MVCFYLYDLFILLRSYEWFSAVKPSHFEGTNVCVDDQVDSDLEYKSITRLGPFINVWIRLSCIKTRFSTVKYPLAVNVGVGATA